MRIFVTGGTGFLGGHFLNAALAVGYEVVSLRRKGAHPRIRLKVEPQWIEGDLDDDHRKTLRHCQAIIHFASVGVSPQISTWTEAFDVNVTKSLKFWLMATEVGVHTQIIAGSCFEYGRSSERYSNVPTDAPLEPTGYYGASKASASTAALALAVERKTQLLIFRPFTVFGDGQHPGNFWPSLKTAAFEGLDFPMTLGEQIRDFTPVTVVVNKFLLGLNKLPEPGRPRILNIGSGRPQTLLAFAEHWWGVWGATGKLKPGAIAYRDNEVMRFVPELEEL